MIGALKSDPDLLALARAARSRGRSLRALLGWTPTQTITTQPDGTQRVSTETEWDYTERNIAVALDEIDAQMCGGCGGDLTVELTDQHPSEDDGDGHFHRTHIMWCRRCVHNEKLRRRLQPEDEELDGTPADNFPTARLLSTERLPIPDDVTP